MISFVTLLLFTKHGMGEPEHAILANLLSHYKDHQASKHISVSFSLPSALDGDMWFPHPPLPPPLTPLPDTVLMVMAVIPFSLPEPSPLLGPEPRGHH